MSADHAVTIGKDDYSVHGDKHALIIQDKATYFSLADHVENRTAEESEQIVHII